jgi:hypothetical protein
LNPASGADASIDSDHDGSSNLEEFKAGTDPQSAASRLTIVLDRSAGRSRVGVQAIAGKTYRLEYRDDLLTGSWRTLVTGISSPATATVQIVDDGSTGTAKRFYRAVIEP